MNTMYLFGIIEELNNLVQFLLFGNYICDPHFFDVWELMLYFVEDGFDSLIVVADVHDHFSAFFFYNLESARLRCVFYQVHYRSGIKLNIFFLSNNLQNFFYDFIVYLRMSIKLGNLYQFAVRIFGLFINSLHLGGCRTNDAGYITLDYTSLLPSNLFQSVSNNIHVIKTDCCDYGTHRALNNIGSIESTAYSTF